MPCDPALLVCEVSYISRKGKAIKYDIVGWQQLR